MKTFRPNATGSNGNGLKKFQGPKEEISPFQLDYKSLEVGDSVRCRILSLSEDDIEYISCKRGNINVPGRTAPISLVVHNLGECLADLVDNDNTPFAEWKGTYLNRVIVWVYGVYKKGKSFEESGELKFVEMGPGLKKSLEELEEAQNGTFAFSEETCCPEYDLLLSIVPGDGTIPKNYIWQGINTIPGKKEFDPNYGVPAEEVLAEDAETIQAQWPLVREAMRGRMTEEYIRFKFQKRNSKDSDAPKAAPVSSRANLQTEESESSSIDYGDDTPVNAVTPSGGAGKRKYSF